MEIARRNARIGIGTWNYRVIRHPDGDDWYYGIHIVHYDADGRARAWTEREASVGADSVEGLSVVMGLMARASSLPTLEEKTEDGNTGTYLVEVGTGKPPTNDAVSDLPMAKRFELESAADAVEEEIAKVAGEKYENKH